MKDKKEGPEISPSLLYDYMQCPHKVWRDRYGPRDEFVDDPNPFLQLLWTRGLQHEERILAGLAGEPLDLSVGTIPEREERTREAMALRKPLLYQPVLRHGRLTGIPDLLELQDDGSYVACDIKSGGGTDEPDSFEEEEGKLNKKYAVQLCLYTDILISQGHSAKRLGYIIRGDGQRIRYDLDEVLVRRPEQTCWQYYEWVSGRVEEVLARENEVLPALKGICKMCGWYASCKQWCRMNDDPTLLFELGQAVRDTLAKDAGIRTVEALCHMDTERLLARKKEDRNFLKGVGEATLEKLQRRAILYRDQGAPVCYERFSFPDAKYELFFDIEDDPTAGFVYMHGIYVREPGNARYLDFTAREISDAGERKAWQGFWDYVRSLHQDDFAVYYYSKHEKSTYGHLQKKYPEVISEKELNDFFHSDRVIDLYDLVRKHTDWPLGSYSIKEIAVYLGFRWRDSSPSGALSIQWFNEYIRTGDEAILRRIREYNEDDCLATLVLKDKLAEMGRGGMQEK